MATATGNASDLEDLFTKIVAFLTTNASLVAASQQWQVLRQRRDNLLSLTSTSLNDPATLDSRKMIQCCRYDSRSINSDPRSSTSLPLRGTYYSGSGTTWTAGANVRMRLRTPREVKTVRLQSPQVTTSTYNNAMFRNFRLQYSDDGVSWTTALTVSSTPTYGVGEWRDHAVPGTPGSHEYWQLLLDSVQSGTAVAWSSILLLEADGVTVANHFGSEVILKATGTAGADEIFTGIRSEYDASAGWYNLFLNGYTGFDPADNNWFTQPGSLSTFESGQSRVVPMVPCWQSAMPYWFSASGRSFRMGLKVSTSYESAYLGFILPYATPGQYPYPLAVAGSLSPSDVAANRSALWRYSAVTQRHGSVAAPGINRETGFNSTDRYPTWSTFYLRDQAGNWQRFQNRAASTETQVDDVDGVWFTGTPPYPPNGPSHSIYPHCVFTSTNVGTGKKAWRECLGGGYATQPCVLVYGPGGPQVIGELDGIFSISGYLNGAENTLDIGGVPAVVLQNAYRTTPHEYWAMTLNP